MDPNFPLAHNQLAQAYLQKHMYDEAVAELQKAVRLSGSSPTCMANLARAYAISGKRSEAVKLLSDLKKRSNPGYSNASDGPVHRQGIHRPVGTAHPTTLSSCGEILRIVCSTPLGPGSHRSFHHPWHRAATTTQAPSVGGCRPRAGRPEPARGLQEAANANSSDI
jgi:tetratricopeptide (TPR) repeat protein